MENSTTYSRACEFNVVDKSKAIPSGCQMMRNTKVCHGGSLVTRTEGGTIEAEEKPDGIARKVLLEVCIF